MPNRTQIVCLHEGERGRSIDPIFIRVLFKAIDPAWIRPGHGNNFIRLVGCGGRKQLTERMPAELRACLAMGGDTTLMVWADLDDDMADGDQLKQALWAAAKQAGVARPDFDQVVFAFAKDRLENWVEFLHGGTTDESVEGPRQKHDRSVADAARILAKKCQDGAAADAFPPSLSWSCQNWRALVRRMTGASR